MAYTPTDWVDGTTPVNAANLDKLEQGLDAADQTATDAMTLALAAQPEAEKGQVNGYASLDAAGKVPLAQLPPVGADLSYDGDWAAPTTYQDGDVVVKDGVAYLCVGGPTTTPPDPVPWGAAALAKAIYGTTLPASPVDGQEAILVNSVSAPDWQWRFRYNASPGLPYPWEFIGGCEWLGQQNGTINTINVWTDLPTPVAFTVPRAGLYSVQAGGGMMQSPSSGQHYVGPAVGASDAGPYGACNITAAGLWGPCSTTFAYFTVAAGAQIRTRVYITVAATVCNAISLRVLPVRVS